jgi:hypothetical protein
MVLSEDLRVYFRHTKAPVHGFPDDGANHTNLIKNADKGMPC